MATAVVMPKSGQSVETCIIVGWKKAKGDSVTQGEPLCDVETDKSTLEVESPVAGTLLELFFQEGEEVAVQVNIAAIGERGEDVSGLRPAVEAEPVAVQKSPGTSNEVAAIDAVVKVPPLDVAVVQARAKRRISPRAANLADKIGLDINEIRGTGPGGRIIERDVQAAMTIQPRIAPVAKAATTQTDFTAPIESESPAGEAQMVPLTGVRKVIAERMLDSVQTTAQFTLNSSADARGLLAYRQRLKNSSEALDLQNITINDLILFCVSRTLPEYPDLNALFAEAIISQHKHVHLGFAVDTPRGLIVPVIRNAETLSLKRISQETRRLSAASVERSISPAELTGGTFTVTNLGNLGIETFTPILNPPQVGILGVGNVNLKPVEIQGDVQFNPHISLSLTINHQAVDGAPAARFLQTLSRQLGGIELLLAL